MNAKQFFDEVAKMRQLQKEYFKTRSSIVLVSCKKQEKLIDAEIERVNTITLIIEPNLFDNESTRPKG